MIFYCNNAWLMYNLDSGEWAFKLLYCNYAQDFMTLHNKDAGLKGNRLMVQRKGNLPVADSRSSREENQEDLDVMATAGMAHGPSSPGGSSSLQQEVSLNWSLCLEPAREPNLVKDRFLLGQGNPLCEDFQWEQDQRPSPLDIIGHITTFSTADL